MSLTVTVGGSAVTAHRASVHQDMGSPGMTASVGLPVDPAVLDIPTGRQAMVVTMGTGGAVFTGLTDGREPKMEERPLYEDSLEGFGRLGLADLPLDISRNFYGGSLTAGSVIASLLTDASATPYSLASGTATIANYTPIILQAGETPLSYIRRLDRVFNYLTFDTPGGTITRIAWPWDAGTPAADHTFVEGDAGAGTVSILKITRGMAVSQAKRIIKVRGLDYPESTREAQGYYTRPHSYRVVGSAPYGEPVEVDDELIETSADAATLGSALARREGIVYKPVQVTVEGSTAYQLGQVVSLTSTTVEIPSPELHLIWALTQEEDANGFLSHLTLRGVGASAGSVVSATPVVGFTVVGSPPFGTAATFSYAGSISKFDSNGPFGIKWSHDDNNPQELSGLDVGDFDAVFVVAGTAVGLSASITLEVEDPKDRLRAKVTKAFVLT